VSRAPAGGVALSHVSMYLVRAHVCMSPWPSRSLLWRPLSWGCYKRIYRCDLWRFSAILRDLTRSYAILSDFWRCPAIFARTFSVIYTRPPKCKKQSKLIEVLGSRDAHINRRDATANTMRVARVCYRGPHASCSIAAAPCSFSWPMLRLTVRRLGVACRPLRLALGQSATGRRGPGAEETAMRDYYTTLRDFWRSYAISRDLSRRYALLAP
jgi:hypothetical protein